MALSGPQVGGISLIVHTLVILFFKSRKVFNTTAEGLINLQRGIFHPYRPDAKL